MKTLALLAVLLGAASWPAAAQEIASDDLAVTLERMYQKAAEKAAASVVAIKVDREPEPEKKPVPAPAPSPRPGFFPRPSFEDVFARRPVDAWMSGTIVDSDGLILTTSFNCAGKVKSIKVLLPDGRELEGKLLGMNGLYDIAAIKVEASGLPEIRRAPLESLKSGEGVVALGRAPDGRGITLNPGIISAASRLNGRGVQTDAKLNFGNVGGPLVDLQGRLVAVTCKVDSKYSSSRGQNSGVGFAVTHDRLFGEILPKLKAGESVAEARRPFLGIEFNQKSVVTDGVELASVQAGGAAEKSGIKAGDVILEFDGKRTEYFEKLKDAILARSPGDRVKVKVRRGEQDLEFDCELGWAPGE
jgi:serine protease Do